MWKKMFLFIFLILSTICLNTKNCKTGMYINTDISCFNAVVLFNQENKNYRAGHFALNKEGDMIVEYSSETLKSSRMFYGLKKNGKYFFPNITKEININGTNEDPYGRYESTNIFVSLEEDINKTKEYLLSISSYKTVVELHDLENGINKIRESASFFNNSYGIFSYVFQVLETQIYNKNVYICIYIFSDDLSGQFMGFTIFGLPNFDLYPTYYSSPHQKINFSSTSSIYYIYNFLRIMSSFLMDYYNIIVIIYMTVRNEIYAIFFEYNLGSLNQKGGWFPIGNYERTIPQYDNTLFFKACYLYQKYVAIVYFPTSTRFNFIVLSYYDSEYTFRTILTYTDTTVELYDKTTLNDFVKVDNNRLIFISSVESGDVLYIIFFDLYNNYKNVGIRFYRYSFNSWSLSSEMSAFIYNGFLAYSGTFSSSEIFSIFLLFGYANGTDSEIDMSPYFIDSDNFSKDKNLVKDLIKNLLTIDNNIFGYEPVEQIKLISIPEEIIFLNGDDDSQISNNDTINSNYKLKQNTSIIKENKFYYLDYQFIVKEPTFPDFINYTYNVNDFYRRTDSDTLINLFDQKYYYGRTNSLKFKLCFNNCKTCKELGSKEEDQKCESCLEEYSYNHIDGPFSECLSENHFYDSENKIIKECTSENSKFYIDITTNKKICFKYEYNCPSNYQNYDSETKECKYYFETSTLTLLTTDFPKEPDTSILSTLLTTKISESITYINIENISTYLNTDFNQELNLTNKEINELIEKELIKNYFLGNKSIEIKGEGNSIFQLTTSNNEMELLTGNITSSKGLTIIELGTCENLLKEENEIDKNLSLIIKKYEQLTISAERNVQYEVYHPITKKKLNLSICEAGTINLYIPVNITEDLIELYNDLKSNGYDLFNIDDPFYNNLCTPYKSKNGTDVLLFDRKNDYYNNNYTTCQSNCQYSSFDPNYKFLKCECKVIVDDIDIKNFNKFSKKIYKTFFDILKNSNYKVLKCYKLVFNLNYFKRNIGNFIVFSFFGLYIGAIIIYAIKEISPLEKEIIKTLHIKFKINNENIFGEKNIYKGKNYDLEKPEKEKVINFPPKKKKSVMIKSNLIFGDKENKGQRVQKTKNDSKNKKKRKSRKSFMPKSDTNDKLFDSKKDINELSNKNVLTIKDKNINKKLDTLDLNNLIYEKALELDKRTFGQIYSSKLAKKHLILYTFFSCQDYNLIYIKIARFSFLICTSMALNVLFFFDSSMHKIYLDFGKYKIISQIPQMLYSSIVSLIIEILIGFLSFTDIYIYQIRQLKKYKLEEINKIIKAIKAKLIIFFIVTFIFFVFYWYLISAFCGVYNNTQIIYIKDFISSFCLGLIYPFVIQLCLAFLRIFSLREKTKLRSILFKIC